MKFEKTKENEYVDMGYSDEEELATNDLEMHFIEIPKFEKKNPGANTKLEQWLWLLAGREEKLEIAKNMLKEKVDIQIIAKFTGLTKEEIDKLIKKT